MEEAKAGAGKSVRGSSSLVAVGGRQRFTVELRPGETTIVSWKKLAKDVSKVNRPTSSAPAPARAPEPQSNAHSALESRLAPDEYFQVDNSTIKHDGFFVNRGKLERTNEPTLLSNQQPKKRRRKDLAKGQGEGDDDHMPNKRVKVGKKVAGKSVPLVGKNSSGHSHIVALPSVHHEDTKFQNQMNSSVICAKKESAETKTLLDPSPPSKVPNGDASLSIPEEKDIDKQKTGMASSKYQGNKLKDGGEFSDPSVQRSHGKSSYTQSKSQPGKLLNNVNESDQSVQRREKDGIRERPDLNVYEGKYSMQTVKAPLMQRKEGLNVRPKSTMLEKAIRELEKMVAESRPPTMEVQDADISSQAVKRRLPHEVKQKLAKVARLAQANHGKISMELVNRLMSIVGHMVQLRTLKRNLKVMVNMGLSAKKEKDDRFQLMKKEVAELIRMRVPYIKSKALEQQAGASDDFQEIGNEEKEVIKRKYSMDDVLEDKICDLYDLYVEGLDEDAGPQVRKLYAELAELWPDGFMDNHGIKRAICRAKDRKRPLHSQHKDQEKIRRKKLIPKIEEAVRVETTTTAQPQYVQEKLVTDSGNHGLTSVSRPVPNPTTANTNVWMPMPSATMNGPNLDRPKQDKVKVTSSNLNDTRTMDALTKKKVKRKPELESSETHFHLEKLVSAQGKERHKPHKHVPGPIRKPSLPLAPLPPQNFERPS
ncbi:Ubinuclein-2 [Camellia lanceoleosa]|uniref:Ubinuclein-2 n=1 Tax=Camellia lanceoleosa TaxID=1840588 RepID=A0ACC0GXZ8_9ERIC|nr:Ubinuclein-2 [Camellia lanceoleosa]